MRTALAITRPGATKELRAAVRAERRVRGQLRLRALLAVAAGEHVPRVAKLLHVAERALRNWVNNYNREGLAQLRDRRGGRRCRLSAEQLTRIRTRLLAEPTPADGVCSLRGVDVRRILREEFGTAYARSSVYYFLHRTLGFSYLKPRPLHTRADLAAQETFKKTSRKSSVKSGNAIRTGVWRCGSTTKAASDNKAP
jgi:transposase